MSRARATALALVNWKGVFYERYLLDRHVTALEGANGAGKTTVMIAAYVVLLPDMSRLRFTNVGESGATGGDKGIWGRLGELGRPSFAALELALPDGQCLLAGVHLERKAEPSVELTPFIVSGLDLGGRLKDLLLVTNGEHEEIPRLDELKGSVAARGGKIEVYATVKEYFSALFERGVTPLRLGTDEERNKLNEMLRTSMTGGISRALTSELRSFLLKEETGLADTLGRMRENLDACHRTRTEVAEARNLEHEISGVYDAGQAMFAAALLGARQAATELRGAVEQARAALADVTERQRELEALVAEAVAQQGLGAERVAAARIERDRAARRHAELARARDLGRRLTELEAELERAASARAAARSRFEASNQERAQRKAERDRAREAYDRAARGLGDLQAGLAELHRNAHAHRHVKSRLEEARALIGDPALDESGLAGAYAAVKARLAELDGDRARVDREAESSDVRRNEHARALAALGWITGDPSPIGAHERARTALAALASSEGLVERMPHLLAERERARELAARQAGARQRAARLKLWPLDGPAVPAVEQRLLLAEGELRAAEEALREHAARALESRRAASDARERAAALELRAVRWAELMGAAERVERVVARRARTREQAAESRGAIAEEREQLRATLGTLERTREDRLREASALEARGGLFHPDLLRLRDDLDAELVAARFEELEPERAARLEAELGPLSQALIVEDPRFAALKVAGQPREVESIWFVHAGATLDEAALAESARGEGQDVLVDEPHGVRLTRVPEHPTLGRDARQRRSEELRTQARQVERELDTTLARLQALEAAARDADALLADAPGLEGGDPSTELAQLSHQIEELGRGEREAEECGARARERAATCRLEVDALRALLGEAFLLEGEDAAERAAALDSQLVAANAAREELRRTSEDREFLARLIEVLRCPPPSDDALAAVANERAGLDRERDRLFRAGEALGEVMRQREALRWSEAERALAEQTAVLPALEAQHARAREAVEAAEEAVLHAEASWEQAATERQRLDAEEQAIVAHVERVRLELQALEAGDGSEQAVLDMARTLAEREAEQAELERGERALAAEIALRRERRDQGARQLERARERLTTEEQAALPAEARWQELKGAAEAADVLRAALGPRVVEAHTGQSSLALFAEARSKAELAIDRLEGARGGAECAAKIREALSSGPAEAGGGALSGWLAARDWLRRRLPAQVADVDDPLLALERLRDHLGLLEERVARQESDLRGTSEDVARGIEVRLRKAKNQVRRLNQNLEGVRFGSIAGIRVDMRRVERMQQILSALRDGAVQELLFQPTLPIEDALNEIFRRYGGGRTGGQRILDYREYIELGVEIQRHTQQDWELASPTRLSTGEAIGVGAALMMVVLTEWERDANLLRAKRAAGSLRFLFLDEANRLSQDNLGVLFDLCENLDLQLLIAAPEVARAEGNTTYRLVRRLTDDGREEVIVSGRRTLSERPLDLEPSAPPPAGEAASPADVGQVTLFDD